MPIIEKQVFVDEEQLDLITLANIVYDHYNNKVGDYVHYYDLYKGKHEILNKTVSDANKPNNRIVNDFHGQIIDTTVGYFLGNPIVVNVADEKVNEELDSIFTENDKDDLFMEVGKEMCIKGLSSVMVYQNEQGETKLSRVPAEDVVFVYDGRNATELKFAIRMYKQYMAEIRGSIIKCEVYSKNGVTYYSQVVKGINNTSQIQAIDTTAVGYEFHLDNDQPAMPHIFGIVPIVPFYNNEEEMSDLAKIESLVEDFDKVLSLASDEHEAYRNAYLMIRNMTINSDTLKRLKEEGVIEVMDDGEVKFITKDIQSGAIDSHLDRIKDNIFRFSQVPDLTDEKFAGNLSGVAIKFKLFGLETKCIIKERKMTKAIKQLLRILNAPLLVKVGKAIDLSKTEIKFTRNIPANLTEIVDTVSKLNGIVDKETLLSLLPFVDNPQDILDKLEEEQKANSVDSLYANDMQKMGLMGGQDPNQAPNGQFGANKAPLDNGGNPQDVKGANVDKKQK